MIRKSTHVIKIAMALGILACSTSQIPLIGDQQPSIKAPSQDEIQLDAAATAKALSDPERAELGVWSLVANLGIGVYTGEGKQVLAGSETGPDDFWLYDFEIPILVQMATKLKQPFSETHSFIAGLGYDGTEGELLRLYRDVYAEFADSFLVSFFSESGLSFEGEPELTPLQQWLLLVDTFVPPNGGGVDTLDTSVEGEEDASSSAESNQRLLCGTIQGGMVQPRWGLIEGTTDLKAIMAARDAYFLMHMHLQIHSVEATIRASADEVHEGHGGPGDEVRISVSLVYPVPTHFIEIPVGGITCGSLINLDFPGGLAGPLKRAEITWQISDVFADHGSFDKVAPDSIPTYTDDLGQGSITFRAQEEAANGAGQEMLTVGHIIASYNLRQYFLSQPYFNVRDFSLPVRLPILPPIAVRIGWHESGLHVRLETEMVTTGDEYTLRIYDEYEGWLTGDDDELSGEGFYIIQTENTGLSGSCTFRNEQNGRGPISLSATSMGGTVFIEFAGEVELTTSINDSCMGSLTDVSTLPVAHGVTVDLIEGRFEEEGTEETARGVTLRYKTLVEPWDSTSEGIPQS